MNTEASTIREDILKKWHQCAEVVDIPEEAYSPEVRIIRDPSEKSNFSFGLIFNNYRGRRTEQQEYSGCVLCGVIKEVKKDPRRNLDLEGRLPSFVVTANKFAICEGFTIAITDPEKPVHTTKNLDGLEEELKAMFSYADYSGFKVFHNGVGAGASIPGHEHWQLTNFEHLFKLAGEEYGLEAADYEQTRNKKVHIIPDFPFAHLIFQRDAVQQIVSFLKKLHEKIGKKFSEGAVPYIMSQSKKGVLIVPSKKSGKIGSGEPAGHFVCKTQEEFDTRDYSYCIEVLAETRFSKDEIDLTNFL